MRIKWILGKKSLAVASGTLTVLLLFFSARTYFLLCTGRECRVEQPSMRLFLADRFVYPIEHVEHSVDNVYFSIKTTRENELSRLSVIFLTWFQTVPGKNLHILADNSSELLDTIASYGFQVHFTPCPVGHTRIALSCKAGMEFELYYEEKEQGNKYEWFCHFDDDVYVNTRALSKLLQQYSSQDSIYLGRYSSSRKDRIPVRGDVLHLFPKLERDSYYFATGAAYCLSASLMSELETWLSGMEKFVKMSTVLGIPDDMVVGMVVESILGHDLISDGVLMHSHLEPLTKISTVNLKEQVTISYGFWTIKGAQVRNVVNIHSGAFTIEQDPTRFYSYHCLRYPDISWCQKPLATTKG